MRRPTGITLTLVAAGLGLASCGTSIDSGNTEPELPYEEAMEEICLRTEARLAELPDPPDEISVADFGSEVAGILGAEADAAREIDPPDESAGDHRAFVANTDEQAAGWTVVAGADDASIGAEMTRLAELTLGRDDLAAAMGIAECRRGS